MNHLTPNTLAAINNSPLNTSASKSMFTFTKANRFLPLKQSTPSLYDKPSLLSKRSTSFGYGSKSSLISKYVNTPSPDKYPKLSDFQPNKKRGFSLAPGRADCKNVSIFQSTKYPAPTDYNCKDNKENAASYSMAAKVKLPQLYPNLNIPGPGKYNCQKINDEKGSCFISKFKSSISFKIPSQSPGSVQKFACPGIGPMTYNTAIPSTGKQLLSKKKTQKSFFFDKKPRTTIEAATESPGPGAYGFFSQFNR